MMTDPIADMLTRIRNGLNAKHETVDVPASKIKLEIAKILKNEGFVKNYKIVQNNKQGTIKIQLKYDAQEQPVIGDLSRVSRPGRRVYAAMDDIPVIKNGLGIAIISTSKGVLTDRAARAANIGGEILCSVW
jgi:small subunit ribosomal protein S8